MGELTRRLTLNALVMPLQHRRPRPHPLHHSDRACQYASADYQHALRQRDSVCRMSRKRHCRDNDPAAARRSWRFDEPPGDRPQLMPSSSPIWSSAAPPLRRASACATTARAMASELRIGPRTPAPLETRQRFPQDLAIAFHAPSLGRERRSPSGDDVTRAQANTAVFKYIEAFSTPSPLERALPQPNRLRESGNSTRCTCGIVMSSTKPGEFQTYGKEGRRRHHGGIRASAVRGCTSRVLLRRGRVEHPHGVPPRATPHTFPGQVPFRSTRVGVFYDSASRAAPPRLDFGHGRSAP